MKGRASSPKTCSQATPTISRSARRSIRRAWGSVSCYIATEQFVIARSELERAASIAALIAADDPTHHAGRQGLIEAYLQIGRAHSFQGEYAPAETWFRKMQTLAAAWVTEEPGNRQARDLLASSLRKLADLKKFSKDYAGARQDYMSAIAIGRDLMKLEPRNLDFKYHLAIALDDLAGVVRDQGELESGADRPCWMPNGFVWSWSSLTLIICNIGPRCSSHKSIVREWRETYRFLPRPRYVFRSVLDQMRTLEAGRKARECGTSRSPIARRWKTRSPSAREHRERLST